MSREGTFSPAALFDAAIDPGREHELEQEGLAVLARPGMRLPEDVPPDVVAIRRAFGEGRLAVVEAVVRVVDGRSPLEAAGITCEGYGDGVFAEVYRPSGPSRALRIAGPERIVASDTVLLQPRSGTRPDAAPILEDEFYEIDAEEDPPAPFADAAAELAFIVDPQRSTLERLPASQRDRYLRFAWHAGDFPGGPAGPNEARADAMFAALTRLRPERRANSGPHAAVTRAEFDAAMQARIRAALVPIPDARGQQLHREAAEAFVRMRAAALADGVALPINNTYRPAQRAAAAAATAGNPAAVASFSSHTLGLAIDFNMSHGTLRFSETTTRPFQNVVDMYKSSVHKWIFLRGRPFGWFPYSREPWHWEYNPDGFRARLRQSDPTTPPEPGTAAAAAAAAVAAASAAGAAIAAGAGAVAGAVGAATGAAIAAASGPQTAPAKEDAAEAITDPIVPARPPLAITGAVGRGGRNNAADVRAVQDRLVQLRALESADATSEHPTATGVVPDTALTRTIAAIEAFQRRQGLSPTAKIGVSGATRVELDRVMPPPTAAEFAAVTAERNGVQQTVSRGLTITGPVGAIAAGNLPDDVRAVQRRLVELRKLAASHRETPPPGIAGAVPQANLRATIAALRSFQAAVRFWLSRRTIAGALTPGVVAPGDATLALLQRISAYTMQMGGTEITFQDHVTGGVVVSDAGVAFSGTASPSAIPVSDFVAQGLQPLQAAALKLVSTFEGNFDAINTYDRALVSAGFIQFAGSRGLPPYLALLKVRQPAKFRGLLQRLGVDVEFTVSQGAITGSRVAVLDPAASRVLLGAAAEAAIRDDKKLTTALILSGRDRDVQLVQIEAAIRNYVMPALAATVSWGAGPASAPLGQLLRSAKGMAALFDRTIQEGLGGSKRRFERIIQRLVAPPAAAGGPPAAPATRAQVQSREGDILAELERDLQAGADVTARITSARRSLDTLIAATRAAGATVAGVLAHAALADARRAVGEARTALAAIVNVSPAARLSVDATITSMNAALVAEQTRLAFAPPPAAVSDLAAAFTASGAALADAARPVSTTAMFLDRVQRIRRSTLDSGLAEAA